MNLLPNPLRFPLAVALSVFVLIGHLYAAVTSEPAEAWGPWIASIVFGGLLLAILHGSTRVLKIGRRVCYMALLASAVATGIGCYGILTYSFGLAMYVIIGAVYALMAAIFLAGIQEAERRQSEKVDKEDT